MKIALLFDRILICIVFLLKGEFMKKKHLTLSDRVNIQSSLNIKKSFTEIADEINFSVSCISREVSKHSTNIKKGAYGKKFNNCKLNYSCKISGLCDDINCNKNYCKFCDKCLDICPEFIEEKCSKLSKPSQVCNGCLKSRNCVLEKRIYNASEADAMYNKILKESRSGFNLTEEKLKQLNELIPPAVKRGLSINAIISEYKDTLMLSETTIYNYISAGIIQGIGNIDLPLKVKYKPRNKKSKEFKVDKSCRINRTYVDFLNYVKNNPGLNIVEIDSVEGKKGGKVLLTIYFRKSNLMLGFIREHNDSKSVTDIFNTLFELLGKKFFSNMFSIILTDNGSEFSNPKALEYIDSNCPNEEIIKVFYCDPHVPGQKGGIEHNHTLLRKIIPKGTSLDDFTQDDIDLAFNHINSYTREALDNTIPYSIFKNMYGGETLKKLGIKFIPFNELNLTPKLLKK